MPPNFDDESAKFLLKDFSQNFQQLRHYDKNISDICKFSFTAYTGLIGISLSVLEYGASSNIDLFLPAFLAMCVGFALGLLNFGFIIRSRAYFVYKAHYLNEFRGFFMPENALKFPNKTGMYTDHTYPPFYNPLSSQMWLMYIIALLNGTLGGALIYAADRADPSLPLILLIFIIITAVQIITGIVYLKSRKDKGAGD